MTNNYWTNAIIYTIGWCWAVYFGARDYPLLGALGVAIPVAALLMMQYRDDLQIFYRDVFLAIYALLIGLIMESVFIYLDLIHYKTLNIIPFLPPIWIMSLYILFALTLNHSFTILNKSPIFVVLVGCMVPLTYLAGHRMGAADFPHGVQAMIAFFVPVWIVFLTLLTRINAALKRVITPIFQIQDDPKPLTMLYDGACPICSREVAQLKKTPSSLKFIDIAEKEFDGKTYGVSYEEAMKSMTAVEADGTILQGVAAFQQIYARKHWYFLAILISAPGFHWLATKIYPYFARWRYTPPT